MVRHVPVLLEVPVRGGTLAVGRWGPRDAPAVVASHGITANHRSWALVADELGDEVALLAVDHRGRGGSADLPGPWGMRTHAEDVLAMLDHLGVDRAVLLGHSLGGFVMANLAAEHPERVRSLVLVDGGLPFSFAVRDDGDTEEVIRAVIGPALERLDRTFASREEYLDGWRRHPAFVDDYDEAAEEYFLYDITGADPAWRSKVSKEAVLEDGRAPFDPHDGTAIERVACHVTLLWAPRGVMDQVPGLYPPEVVADATARMDRLQARRVDDVNHYGIVLTRRGAAAVSAAVRAAVAAR